ncbi:MAG: diguanylate cyclase regulator RdcB family protein [Scandinavium sp.]|uniref:diguanylate cyclase regulator RdcB family protein n=1 Tax=Scandinavium sp. TaxID=2830653 RepID=UPI003F30F10B
MNTRLLEGPGRALESLHARFMVDLVLGIDNPRQHALAPQQQQFRERLMNEIVAQTQLRPWSAAGLFSDNPAMRLGLAEKLASQFDPGHLALTRMSDYLLILQAKSHASVELRQQYGLVGEQFSLRAGHKQRALTQRGLMVQSGLHSDEVFTRWHAGQYDGWSLAGRCYVALEELRWGAFGDTWRLANPEVRALLKDSLRTMTAQYLAEGIGAAKETRHSYHQWLASPASVGLMDHKEMLAWMGSNCDAVRQPVCWSVTQTWQPVALGMPRLCSATRLVDAMIEELFVDES